MFRGERQNVDMGDDVSATTRSHRVGQVTNEGGPTPGGMERLWESGW